MRKHPYAFLLWFVLVACVQSSSEAQTVYVTKTGAKYHRGDCHYLKYSKFPITLSNAEKQGYTPCSFCRPDIKDTAEKDTEPAIDSAQQDAETTPPPPIRKAASRKATTLSQCTARTKAGTRCKRMTTNANARCWQHQE